MPKVKLTVVEINAPLKIPADDIRAWGLFGSSPRNEGECVEGHRVPQGKVWLFPRGNDSARVTNRFGGTVLEFWCDL